MSTIKKITILLIILALAGAGILAYRAAVKKSAAPAGGTVSVKEQEFNSALKKLSASDQDLDGIPDSEEAKYQTSPTSVDTDDDGLTDQQEVFVFKTNPLKSDTDGDGSADGYEVRRGLNPLVKGK
mgnify:FL=1